MFLVELDQIRQRAALTDAAQIRQYLLMSVLNLVLQDVVLRRVELPFVAMLAGSTIVAPRL